MVHRLAAHPRRADEDLELLARLRLADVLGEPLRPQRALDRLLVGRHRRAADDAGCRAGAARRRRAGRELVGLDAHGSLSSAARRPRLPRQSPRAATPRRLPPDLVAVRRRAAAEERGADAGQRRRRPAGPRDGRGVRRLRRRHVEARGAVAAPSPSRSIGSHADHADHAHHGHHAHHAEGRRSDSGIAADGAPAHGPASRVAHGGDHCALSALAFALASDAPAVAARPATVAPMPAAGATAAPVVDPAARWAAQLQHAPPASS